MESHNKDYMDPHLNMKRSRYAEKESERYAGDLIFFSYQGTNNKFVFTFVFLLPPPPTPPPIAISVLAQCEQNLKHFSCSILPSIE